MKAAILSVGTELLFGQTVNTNSVYLSQELNQLGIDVLGHYTVGDNAGRLEAAIEAAFKECDLILATGGLGPTQDDLTKETVCRVMGDELVLNEEALARLERRFSRSGWKMTENNRKQAWFPSRATVLMNDLGTAPGFRTSENGRTIVCMPGPPREMRPMFEQQVKPWLSGHSDQKLFYRTIRTFGIGESSLETELLDLIDQQTDPTLATYAKEGECSLRIASKRMTIEEAKQAVDQMTEQVTARIGEYIYSYDDEELAQVVAQKLIDRKLTLAAAESCTGGLFSKVLTDFPGMSAVFDRGLVTYSNRAKIEELGVSTETLERFGAVSRETALAMARGLAEKTACDLAISVTGIAGPTGDTKDKPLGLVYIALVMGEREDCIQSRRRNVSRAWNRQYAVLQMFDRINRMLDGRIGN